MPVATITQEQVAALIRPRQPETHKGNYGHALLVAGNTGRMGAAVLAALACVRTGAGLTTVNIPFEERQVLQAAVPEAMLGFREQEIGNPEKYNAIGIGPALGTDEQSRDLLGKILGMTHGPLLLDADAFTILAQNQEFTALIPPKTILTPPPKEFDRLFGEHDTAAKRTEKAIDLAFQRDWVMVLKGHHTLVASRDHCTFNTTGNPGLAKGGSGDVLTGMITALLAQGYEPANAALVGVYLHGLAADIALSGQSEESLLATDVIAAIGKAYMHLR